MPDHHHVVVMGASAGGIDALAQVLSQLPPTLEAAVCLVQHIASTSPGWLPRILGQHSALPVTAAQHGEAFQPGHVYVAPPDRHLLLTPTQLQLSQGPRENHTRPAIDVLFRSAAVAHGPHVIGVLLTGLLDDGSAGLEAIQRCGGKVVVQDPDDAEYPEMPRSALECVKPDVCAPLVQIGHEVTALVPQPAGPARPAPADLRAEVELAMGLSGANPRPAPPGEPAGLSCPECGGPLVKAPDEALDRYRCVLGHAFTVKSLSVSLDNEMERTLWAALRAMEERADLYKAMARRARRHRLEPRAREYEQEAQATRAHSQQLRQLLADALASRRQEQA